VEKREALKIWTVLLAIGTFSLSLSGTFLVRSGLLNSVHTFASDPTRGVFILALLAIVIGGSLLLFALRAPVLSAAGVFAPVSREGAIVLNNILLCSLAAVVLTGTMYPPMAELLFGAKLSVGPPYFHDTVIPLVAPLFAAMSLGPILPWKRADLGAALMKLWWAALAAALVGIAVGFGVRDAFAALGLTAATWMILGAAAQLVERTRLFRLPWRASRERLGAQPLAVWGAAVAHAGMGVTIAGIAGMALASSSVVAVKTGQTVALGGYDWTLLGLHNAPGPDYVSRVADLRVTRDGRQVALMHPARHDFTVQHQNISDASIITNGMRDLYAVLGDERDGQVVLRLHVNLMAPWIWLGALVMALGGGLSLADRRLRVGAPARRRRAAQTVPAE
ncbi:MAG TPA: cytochrome c-type biogenesis CcmF C-terminal domain-containing protein, partial [Acetobacteraceae bacterium]